MRANRDMSAIGNLDEIDEPTSGIFQAAERRKSPNQALYSPKHSQRAIISP